MAFRSSFIFVTLILIGCAETARVIKDDSVNMKRYKIYAWVQNVVPKDAKSNPAGELTEQSIRNAVNLQLQKRGYVESATNPDLLVSTDLLAEKNEERRNDAVYSESYTRTYYDPNSARYVTYYFPSQLVGFDNYSVAIKKGTITLTFIDTKTNKAVWQGWASKKLYDNNIDSDEIFQDVRSIFNKFDGN